MRSSAPAWSRSSSARAAFVTSACSQRWRRFRARPSSARLTRRMPTAIIPYPSPPGRRSRSLTLSRRCCRSSRCSRRTVCSRSALEPAMRRPFWASSRLRSGPSSVMSSWQSRRERFSSCLGFANVYVVHGDGSLGLPEHAPFDRILVAAAAPRVPESLVRQLAEGGRLVVPVGTRAEQQVEVIRKINGEPSDEQA